MLIPLFYPDESSTADFHLKLLDMNQRSYKFLIVNFPLNLKNQHSISSLHIIKFFTTLCILYSEFPNFLSLKSRNFLNANSLYVSQIRFNFLLFQMFYSCYNKIMV